MRRTRLTFSMSMPSRPSFATAIMIRSPECDWLKDGPSLRKGFPCLPWLNRMRSGGVPVSLPTVRRRWACATV